MRQAENRGKSRMKVEPRRASAVWRVYQSLSESPSDRESESKGASSDITHTTNLIKDRRLSFVCLLPLQKEHHLPGALQELAVTILRKETHALSDHLMLPTNFFRAGPPSFSPSKQILPPPRCTKSGGENAFIKGKWLPQTTCSSPKTTCSSLYDQPEDRRP